MWLQCMPMRVQLCCLGLSITTFWVIPMAGICASWCQYVAHMGVHCFSQYLNWRMPDTTQTAVPLAIQLIKCYIQLLGLNRVTGYLSLPYMWEEVFFPGLVPPTDMVNSKYVVGVKPGDFRVVTGYQVDKSSHTWLAECFVCLITHFSQVHRQGFNSSWPSFWTR